MQPSERAFAGRLALVTVAALALRVLYVVVFRVPALPLLYGDSLFYDRGANLLANGHGFIEPFAYYKVGIFSSVNVPSRSLVESATHPPLYLAWLAIPSYIWPGHATTPTVHMLWSCLLGTDTVVLCGLAAREVAGARVGLIAAVLAAAYPNLWVYDGLVLSETMAIFASAGVILLAYRFWNRPSFSRALWLGASCGLAGLARPELVLAAPLVLAPLALRARDVDWPRRLTWLVAGALATTLVLAPWVLYNRARFHEPVYLSTNLGGTIAAANCDDTYSGTDIGFKSYRCGSATYGAASAKRAAADWRALDESEVDAAVQDEAMRYVRAHLSRAPLVILARWGRVAKVFHPFQEVAVDQQLLGLEQWVAYALVLSFWVVAALAVAGAVVLARRRVLLWPLLAVPLIVLVSVAITLGQTRYRAPAEPALVILGAVGLDVVRTRVVGHLRRGRLGNGLVARA